MLNSTGCSQVLNSFPNGKSLYNKSYSSGKLTLCSSMYNCKQTQATALEHAMK